LNITTPLAPVSSSREERRQLDRHRNPEELFQLGGELDDLMLDGRARHLRVGDHFVQVQLQSIRPRLFNQPRKRQPRFRRRAVERSNHRDADGAPHAGDMLRVSIRSEGIFGARRKLLQRHGAARLVHVVMMDSSLGRHCHLLFEHGGQDDRGGSAVLEALDVIELAAERGSPSHEGMREPESHHRRREIHLALPRLSRCYAYPVPDAAARRTRG
jgi:hypothetical protein